MKDKFEVSVVVPVFNAEKYLRRAVESVVQFGAVKQLILVEDGSPDGSYELCRTLAQEFSIIELFQHAEGVNKGAGASRNLGISKCKCSYVAFLDADDYYLPNRFDVEIELLPSAVLNCISGYTGCDFDSEEAKKEYAGPNSKGVKYNGLPNDFWLYQSPTGHAGTFTTNAITIHKSLLNRIGGFDDSLRVSQDTELWIRLGIFGRFAFSGPEPVAMRYVYVGNRSRLFSKIRMHRPLMYLRLITNTHDLKLTNKQQSVYSSFLLIHLVKNLMQIFSYDCKDRRNLLNAALAASLMVAKNISWVIRFHLSIRPNTKNV